MEIQNKRLIEAGFPCHQVGAETQRERGASSALPPLYFMHVWWARRPLTPSRAAILGALLPGTFDSSEFARLLGLEKLVIQFPNNQSWVLSLDLQRRLQTKLDGSLFLSKDEKLVKLFESENRRRSDKLDELSQILQTAKELASNPSITQWIKNLKQLDATFFQQEDEFYVQTISADPSAVNKLIEICSSEEMLKVSEKKLTIDEEDLYGYQRGYKNTKSNKLAQGITVLDPTSGGGSIPFEAMRLGCNVIANELNPVASSILHATIEFPFKFGESLLDDISSYGSSLVRTVESNLRDLYYFSSIPAFEEDKLRAHLRNHPELVKNYINEFDYTGFLYARQVTCPHCKGETPLLNTHWLSKDAKDPWGVRVIPDGSATHGKISFETYQGKRGPNGEDPEQRLCSAGTGQCVHCKQAIDGDEIKAQARGESPLGQWKDRLYAVVAVRHQPKLDAKGNIQRFKTGERAGEIKTEKIRYFRAPNQHDLEALSRSEQYLADKWDEWESEDLIPTEAFPKGNDMRPVTYGMPRWCDMFTPRQLVAGVSLVEELLKMKPQIVADLGEEKAKAVTTYLQFAIDKFVDYNSKQTRWHFGRGAIVGTFGRHDFSLKWTFGEMIATGPSSGAAWGLSQILDAYKGICELLPEKTGDCTIINGSGASMSSVADKSVDLVITDPPYYNNVQYSELSDFYYVWQKRGLRSVYPNYFSRRVTNKTEEAVANPSRDGSAANAKKEYERLMTDIYSECRRVLKDDGVMTMMFTHKDQSAWETLTTALIEAGWIISSSFPVESESGYSTHQKDMAAASSTIFITCRKRDVENKLPSTWTGLGGTGVAQKVRNSVRQAISDFAHLELGPVDQMIACYGKALQVLSENWPVLDGDETVGPTRAMNEAARVVAGNEISRITDGRLSIDDIDPESSAALTMFGIFGLGKFSFDEANNIGKSLNIKLDSKSAGYRIDPDDRLIGYNVESSGKRSAKQSSDDSGYHAPLVRKGSNLRISLPAERSLKRLQKPQGLWDVMQGALIKFEEGDIPVAKAYLDEHADGQIERVLDLLEVWAKECGDKELRRQAESLIYGLRLQKAA